MTNHSKRRITEKYGPWAVVTGASDGIGRAFCERLAREGFNLVLVARREPLLEQLARSLHSAYHHENVVISADLATSEGRTKLDTLTNDLDVGLIVACAGFGTAGPFVQSDLEKERELLELNCYAVLQACRVFGERFRQRGRGGLVLLSSIVGWQGTPWSAHYAASKAYIQSLAEALAVEFAGLGIDVLASAPGPVKSGFAARAGMRMNATVSPETVADESLRALGRRKTVLPGALSKILTRSLQPLPRSLRTRVMSSIMAGMIRR
jgi:short-subunit dehydrogenase